MKIRKGLKNAKRFAQQEHKAASLHPRLVNWNLAADHNAVVYVGRPSKWGNLYTIREHGLACMRLYFDWLRDDPGGQAVVWGARTELPGKTLGCPCAGQHSTCHGEVLARLADGEALAAIRLDVLNRLGLESAQGSLFGDSSSSERDT